MRWNIRIIMECISEDLQLIETYNTKVMFYLFGYQVWVQVEAPQLILYLKTGFKGTLLALIPPECVIECLSISLLQIQYSRVTFYDDNVILHLKSEYYLKYLTCITVTQKPVGSPKTTKWTEDHAGNVIQLSCSQSLSSVLTSSKFFMFCSAIAMLPTEKWAGEAPLLAGSTRVCEWCAWLLSCK